jgi:flagellar basal body-associated protein FliL
MAADQIFIVVLLLVCVTVVAWMGVNSHRADVRRPKPPAPPPAPDPPSHRRR